MDAHSQRHFLFLQGPHGPFFDRLARSLISRGCRVCRVGFNAGDRAFWRLKAEYVPFLEANEKWPSFLRETVEFQHITDIVLYGDTREVHATSVRIARELGLKIHVFEEGYIRPYWVTYERDGSNGHSHLMGMSIDKMRDELMGVSDDSPTPPAHWGDMRQHIFYAAAYHWFVLFRNGSYKNFKPHRANSLREETRHYTRRLLLMPAIAIRRWREARRIQQGKFEFDLALLQLEHDASFLEHSPFGSMNEFIEKTIKGFALGAPAERHLVFKSHPLESERTPLKQLIDELGRTHKLEGRLHYIQGGKLGTLLDTARSVITINSTAAQQALWRGLPVKAFGNAVYSKPEMVSSLPIEDFFEKNDPPDTAAYRDYRRYLLETSQIPGGFYASKNRKQLVSIVTDKILASDDPYETLTNR